MIHNSTRYSDLAKLYGCKNGTKSINLVVKRHLKRFPEEFMFQLTESESKTFWFQVETKKTNIEKRGGKYNKPYVFTEEGVAMLAAVIRTPIAEEASIKIMRAFVSMRKFINENKDIFKRLATVEYEMIECKDKIDELFDKMEPKKIEKQRIFFNEEIYDSYSLIIGLISDAKNMIIIIDNYIDKSS